MNTRFSSAQRCVGVTAVFFVMCMVSLHAADFSLSGDPAAAARRASGANRYLENAGQVYDSQGEPRHDVRFIVHTGDATLYLRNEGLSYVFRVSHAPSREAQENRHSRWAAENTTVETVQFDVAFEGMQPDCRIVAEGREAPVFRYYAYADQEHPIEAHQFRRVTYEGLYPGIDLVFHFTGETLKYDFIVHPGADPSLIRLVYSGHESLEITAAGELRAATVLGEVTEDAPYAFMPNGQEVSCAFRLRDDRVSFALGTYDSAQRLVIDPSLIWGTYYGGSSDDFLYDVTSDANGYVYAVGQTTSSNQISTAGAFQTFPGGTQDGFLVKMDSSGTVQWATYYGDFGYDEFWGVAVDTNGTIYACGKSDNNGLGTTGVHQPMNAGAGDAILVRFDANGVRQWATYFGGTSQDYGYRVALEDTSYVYITGYTFSNTHIASSNAFQTSIGGSSDAFLAKFSSAGALEWSTYYGGSQPDEAQSVKVDSIGNVFFCGNSRSANNIATFGTHQSVLGGSNDAFIAKFTSSGARTWGSYFGGNNYDRANYLVIDTSGYVYFTGKTSSSSGIATSGAAQTAYGGGIEDGYVAKISGSGSLQWATYVGGSQIDEGHGIVIGTAGHIVITGNTGSTQNIATPGAFQTAIAGGTYDAYAVAHDAAGSKIWGTYYGGGGHDYGFAITDGPANAYYLVGRTGSYSGMATSGAHQGSCGGSFDGYVAKIRYATAAGNAITTGSVSPLQYCAGENILVPFTIVGTFLPGNIFTAQLSSASGSFAAPVPIGTLAGTAAGTITAKIPENTGFGTGYRVRVVSSNPAVTGSDNGINITIYPRPSVGISPSGVVTICEGDSVGITASGTGLTQYQWYRNGTVIPGAISRSIIVREAGRYWVRVTNSGGCPALSDSLTVQVHPLPPAVVTPPGPISICSGDSVVLHAQKAQGLSYQWHRNSQVLPGETRDSLVVRTDGDYYVVVSNGFCARPSNIVQVTLNSSPRVDIYPPGPVLLCAGSSVTLQGPSGVGYTYQWYRQGLPIPGATSVTLLVTTAGMYAVGVRSSAGCSAMSQQVEVRIAPADPTKLVWTGSIDTDWSTVGNWDNPCAIPTTGDTVIINPGTSVPLRSPPIELSVLEMDNSAGLQLGGKLQITEELRLVEGHIFCGDHDIHLWSSAFISNASHNSFVVTDGSGRLVIDGIGLGGSAILFPVGFSSTDYLPLKIQNTGATDHFALRVTEHVLQDGTSGTPVGSHVVDATWHIQEMAPGGSNATLVFQWDNKHEQMHFNHGDCAAAHYSGSGWQVLQSFDVAQGGGPFTRTVSGITTLSPFAITDRSSSIPVELSAFTARLTENGVLLHWRTETETDNLGFDIQRRGTEHAVWRSVGFVRGGGSTTRPMEYHYLDSDVSPGVFEYRLRQIDFSGTSELSASVTVSVSPGKSGFHLFTNYPNPFNPATTIAWHLPGKGRVRLEVYSALGRKVFQRDLGEWDAGHGRYRFTMPPGLPAGPYIYRVTTPYGSSAAMMTYLP